MYVCICIYIYHLHIIYMCKLFLFYPMLQVLLLNCIVPCRICPSLLYHLFFQPASFSSDFRTEEHLNKSFTATLTKPFLIKLPKYKALPRPTFKWKFKGKLVDDYVDASDDQFLYITDIGDLLIDSVKLNHITTYRVTISHQALLGNDVTYFYTLSSKGRHCIFDSA